MVKTLTFCPAELASSYKQMCHSDEYMYVGNASLPDWPCYNITFSTSRWWWCRHHNSYQLQELSLRAICVEKSLTRPRDSGDTWIFIEEWTLTSARIVSEISQPESIWRITLGVTLEKDSRASSVRASLFHSQEFVSTKSSVEASL